MQTLKNLKNYKNVEYSRCQDKRSFVNITFILGVSPVLIISNLVYDNDFQLAIVKHLDLLRQKRFYSKNKNTGIVHHNN